MTTELFLRRTKIGDGGFTLIEVLVAMVILAIGLLGLQALGIGAFRAVHQGQKNSEFAIVATEHMEEATHLIRSGCLTDAETGKLIHEDDALQVLRTIQAGSTAGNLDIIIEVAPVESRLGIDPEAFVLTSSAFITGNENGC